MWFIRARLLRQAHPSLSSPSNTPAWATLSGFYYSEPHNGPIYKHHKTKGTEAKLWHKHMREAILGRCHVEKVISQSKFHKRLFNVNAHLSNTRLVWEWWQEETQTHLVVLDVFHFQNPLFPCAQGHWCRPFPVVLGWRQVDTMVKTTDNDQGHIETNNCLLSRTHTHICN